MFLVMSSGIKSSLQTSNTEKEPASNLRSNHNREYLLGDVWGTDDGIQNTKSKAEQKVGEILRKNQMLLLLHPLNKNKYPLRPKTVTTA